MQEVSAARPGRSWQLSVNVRINGEVAEIDMAGRLGAATAAGLRDALEAKLVPKARHVVVDLGAVDYASSAGIAVLLELSERVKSEGGEFTLKDVNESIRLVLSLAGLA